MSSDQRQPQEIIIVKRRGGLDHESHHGGVWKIAFADFMTAMMAFFLVLWIVNSTSKETQAAIARYFNPLKISDTTPAPRGLKESRLTDFDASLDELTKEVPKQRSGQIFRNDGATKEPEHRTSLAEYRSGKIDRQDIDQTFMTDLYNDPDDVLNGIISRWHLSDALASAEMGPSTRTRAREFIDPFGEIEETTSHRKRRGVVQSSTLLKRPNDGPRHAPSSEQGLDKGPAAKTGETSPNLGTILRNEIDSQIYGSPLRVSVESDQDGFLISLSDSNTFRMFQPGSAIPSPDTIIALEAIARSVGKMPGSLIIRGHTDAHPFRSGVSDNWRLSASRAQVAYFALRRAGLPDGRFLKLESHGERAPINKNDPFANENRRIEILLTLKDVK